MNKNVKNMNKCLHEGRELTSTLLGIMSIDQLGAIGVAIMAGTICAENEVARIIYNLAALPLAEEITKRAIETEKKNCEDLSRN